MHHFIFLDNFEIFLCDAYLECLDLTFNDFFIGRDTKDAAFIGRMVPLEPWDQTFPLKNYRVAKENLQKKMQKYFKYC